MRIRLYGLLRDAAARTSTAALEVSPGDQVSQVLDRLVAQYPRMRPLLFERPGQLLPYVMIVVNGRDVRDGDGLATAVQPADEMAIFPPSAGG